jgi:protein-S-isoprenylcysteine O-methyltransferase Ste14
VKPALKTLAVAVVLHGVFTVTLPYLILRLTAGTAWAHVDLGPARWAGALLAAFGAYLYVWSVIRLLRRNTSAIPGQTATALQRDGWYGVVRHPLLLGVVAILAGEALYFASPPLAAYAAAYWIWLDRFVAFKEEPELRRAFGPAYDDYCREVRRWLPRVRGRSYSRSW